MYQYIPYYERCAYRQADASETVMASDLYDPDESLIGLVRRMSNPNNSISTVDYINLATKYTLSYIFRNEKEAPVSENLMRYFFTAVGRVTGVGGNNWDDSLRNNISLSGYQLAMASDLPKTVAILRDIVEYTHPEASNDIYTGVDLGSGTGILLLGQYIQAKRCGFRHISLHGIEQSPMAATNANRLMCSLGAGKVHEGDTTTTTAYQKYQIGGKNLRYVSNENVPRTGVAFRGKNIEPQFANMQALRKIFLPETIEQAGHFPRLLQWRGVGKSLEIVTGEAKDGYNIEKAREIEEENTGIPINQEEPFNPTTIVPIGISLGKSDDIIPLSLIGENYHANRPSNPDAKGLYGIDGLTRW